MLHADPFHSYCVALVVAAQAALEDWAADHAIEFVDFSDLCSKEETIKEVLASLVKVLLYALMHACVCVCILCFK